MTLREKWYHSGKLHFLGAVLLNAVFLAVLLVFITPGFESNDDLTIASFIDGQMAARSAYIPYINYGLALLLKGIYTLLGESVAWHTVGQYILLFSGFTAIVFVLFQRLRFWQGATLGLMLLLFFGANTYIVINYTKTASIAGVGGVLLMLQTVEQGDKGRKFLPLALGTILALFGFALRYMEFLPCGAIMAVLGLRWLLGLVTEKGGEHKLQRSVSYFAPFAILLVLIAGLYAFDAAAWIREPWHSYGQWNTARQYVMDYGVRHYDVMSEQYDALGLTDNAVKTMGAWGFFDPDVFTTDCFRALRVSRDAAFPLASPGEIKDIFTGVCLPAWAERPSGVGFIVMLGLWLLFGKHQLKDWLSVLIQVLLFIALNIYLIHEGRYLFERVDLGLFLSMACVLVYMLDRDKLQDKKRLGIPLLTAAIIAGVWLNREKLPFEEREDKSGREERFMETVDAFLSDDEHIFFYNLHSVDMYQLYFPGSAYDAFELLPTGYKDKLIMLGSWTALHPSVMENLAKYSVTNPYRDMINNEQVYVIHNNIDMVIAYIHDYYDASAYAELVEPLSSETGYNTYRILS